MHFCLPSRRFIEWLEPLCVTVSFTSVGDTMSLKNPNVVNPKHKKRAAIVISNPAVSTTTGCACRLLVERAFPPYYQ